MAFYTGKTTTAKAVFKGLVFLFLIVIMILVRKNLCMTPQELALRCISANHGLDNWDPQEMCALLTFLLILLGLAYTGESILDIVVAAWENKASGAQPGARPAQPGAQPAQPDDDKKKTGGLSKEAVIAIGVAIAVVLVGGVGIAIYKNWKVPGSKKNEGVRDMVTRGAAEVKEDFKNKRFKGILKEAGQTLRTDFERNPAAAPPVVPPGQPAQQASQASQASQAPQQEPPEPPETAIVQAGANAGNRCILM